MKTKEEIIENRNCQCDICKLSRKMKGDGHSHYLCIPANNLTRGEIIVPTPNQDKQNAEIVERLREFVNKMNPHIDLAMKSDLQSILGYDK